MACSFDIAFFAVSLLLARRTKVAAGANLTGGVSQRSVPFHSITWRVHPRALRGRLRRRRRPHRQCPCAAQPAVRAPTSCRGGAFASLRAARMHVSRCAGTCVASLRLTHHMLRLPPPQRLASWMPGPPSWQSRPTRAGGAHGAALGRRRRRRERHLGTDRKEPPRQPQAARVRRIARAPLAGWGRL